MTTFFHGRQYDQDDWQAIDAKAVGDLSRELQDKEKKQRSKYAGGLFPKEIEEMEEMKKQKAKPKVLLNFPKLEKKQGIGTGEIIGLLDALGEEEVRSLRGAKRRGFRSLRRSVATVTSNNIMPSSLRFATNF